MATLRAEPRPPPAPRPNRNYRSLTTLEAPWPKTSWQLRNYSSGFFHTIRKANLHLFHEASSFCLLRSEKCMLIMFRGEPLFLCSTRRMLVYYTPTCLLCPLLWTLISYPYYALRGRCLFLTPFKADDFLHPSEQVLIYYAPKAGAYPHTFWGKCLFIMLHEEGTYLLCYMRWISTMSIRWMYVPQSTSYVMRPFPPEEVELVPFTYTALYIYIYMLRILEHFF